MKEFYYLISDFRGCAAGDKIRIHDWNNVEVEVCIKGSLEWIPRSVFNTFFTDDLNKVKKNKGLNGFRFEACMEARNYVHKEDRKSHV